MRNSFTRLLLIETLFGAGFLTIWFSTMVAIGFVAHAALGGLV